MQPTDATAFRELVSDTLAMYSKEISVGTQRLWWAALADHDFDVVRRAFSAHIIGKRGQFAPLPANILNLIRGVSGHLGADEAWALVLESTDESRTVVWTPEIAEASAAARTCLDNGDKYGARKAFESAYERIMRTAAATPKWTVSLGDDKSHRIIALEAGHEAGRLSDDQVRHLLPHKKTENNVVAYLTGKSAEPIGLDPRWTELRKKLDEQQSEAEAERERSSLAASKAFDERRQKAIDALGVSNG